MFTTRYEDTSPVRIDRILNKVRDLWHENPDESLYRLLRGIAYSQQVGGTMGDVYLERLLDEAIHDDTLHNPKGWPKLDRRDRRADLSSAGQDRRRL